MRVVRLASLIVPLFCLTFEQVAVALSLSVPVATVGTLQTNATATSLPSQLVVSGLPTESWVLRVDVTTTGASAGHMTRVTDSALCNQGVAVLAQPLHLSFSRTLPTTTIVRAEYDLASLSNPVVAQGTVPDAVNVVYSQPIGVEAIGSGCEYGVAVRYTVSAI